ncbi:hypothetical protein ACF063_42345 [Streptomyces chartreusis]|uniref:hypothetical protein n=1 Tax=Streptomyces chartreusis TaxID=1969 RepID=UPI00368E2E9D
MNSARLISYVFGGLSALYAGYYVVLYLVRWEWQRALICGVLLLIIEVFLATVTLLARFSRLDGRLSRSDARMEEIRRRLEETRAPAPNRFRWMHSADFTELNGTHRTFVFVPILMVAGAALSGAALVIQKVASATVRPGAERRLAGRLTALTAPSDAPGAGAPRLEDRPAVPRVNPGRKWFGVAAAVASLLLVPVLWSALADATQTRPQEPPRSAGTTMVFQIATHGEQSTQARQLAANDLWETCRRSTAAANDNAVLNQLHDDVYVAVVRPALPSHDLMRLRGCLQDANTHRTTATVLGEGQANLR